VSRAIFPRGSDSAGSTPSWRRRPARLPSAALALSLSLCGALAAPGCGPSAPAMEAPKVPTAAAPEPSRGGDPLLEEIASLEGFLGRHSGPSAHPDFTPRAYFQLAALRDEQAYAASLEGPGGPLSRAAGARGAPASPASADNASVGDLLDRSAAAWLALWVDFPAFPERAAVAYHLGRALDAAGRWAEAQQAYRGLVCSDRQGIRPVSPGAEKIVVEAKPQDHDELYWERWGAQRTPSEETTYRPIYDASCKPLPQPRGNAQAAGEPARYVAEVWLRIGDHHAERMDPRDGPYALNRAASAYRMAIAASGEPSLKLAAMLRLSATLLRQGRVDASVKQNAEALGAVDAAEAADPALPAEYREEAVALAADALLREPQPGPGEGEPLSPPLRRSGDGDSSRERDDGPAKRVQSPALLPQDRRSSLDVYARLGEVLLEGNRPAAAVKVLEAAVARFADDARTAALSERLEQARRLVPSPIVLGKGAADPERAEDRGASTGNTGGKKKRGKGKNKGTGSGGVAPSEHQASAAQAPRSAIAIPSTPAFQPDPALPLVRRCYARSLEEHPGGQGRLSLSLRLSEGGVLESLSAAVAGQLDPALAACFAPDPASLDRRRMLPPGTEAGRRFYRRLSAAPLLYDLFDGEVFPVR
jgi:tetratricopeptide (TPR) repeat protein